MRKLAPLFFGAALAFSTFIFPASPQTIPGGGGGGGGGTPGGSNTQLQYNNSGAFGGISGATSNGTSVTLTSPTLVTPALGIPASGTATNLTGTAAGLTAGHVTTNANLTGPITSSGNATAIGAQTGTGSTFVMSAAPTVDSPTFTTALTATGLITNADLAGSIAASKLVGTDITTVGTITTGTWAGTTVTAAHGGTGVTSLGTGVAGALGTNVSGTGAICLASGSSCSGISGLTVGTTTITSGTTAHVEIDTSGVLQELPYGLTGNSTLIETTSGGLLTPSILPLATTSAFGGVKCDGTTITCTAGVITATGAGAVSISSASSNLTVSPNPITGTGTIAATYPNNAQTGTTYTLVAGDAGSLLTNSNTSATVDTIPNTTTTGFGAGASGTIQNINTGLVTFTSAATATPGFPTLYQGQTFDWTSLGGSAYNVSNVSLPFAPANTFIGNATGSAAWPVPLSMPSCSATGDALLYTSGTGISCSTIGNHPILAVNFSGVPANSQTFTFIVPRAFTLPSGLTGSEFAIGTNPTSTLTVTLYKNGSSIGTVAFSTGGSPTVTFSSSTSFSVGDILTAVCPSSADATGADIALDMIQTLN